jgi:hypothetical protein
MKLEARATRRPGDKGTKRLLERYGTRLLFVRYRYNPETRRMLTTAELIVSERPVQHRGQAQPPASTPPAEEVGLRIAARERWLRDKVRAAGGYWDPRRGLWILAAAEAVKLRVSSRVVIPAAAIAPVATGSNRSTLEATL